MILVAPPIETSRLRLVAWTPEFVDALLARDAAALLATCGGRFQDPIEPPPETGDVLPYFRSMLAEDPIWQLFPPRVILRQADSMAVGSAGVTGPPDDEGFVLLGYSVYPAFEGNGYGSESAQALVNWALKREHVVGVRATIHPANTSSQKVAIRAGLWPTGRSLTTDDGLVDVWETPSLLPSG